MKHNFRVDGLTIFLRPVEFNDASFIVNLRNNPDLSKHLHLGAKTVDEQIIWLNKYFARSGDFYFVIEDKKQSQPVGLISLYDVSLEQQTAEWGRWILIPSSLAAVESAWLIYRFAFISLGLDKVFCRTLTTNNKVIAFHESFGAIFSREIPNFTKISSQFSNAVEHFLTQERFQLITPQIEKLITKLARTRGIKNAN